MKKINSNLIQKTHPFGYLSSNKEATLGLIRVSKCGSTTFSTRHHLDLWIPFSQAHTVNNLLCFIRHPLRRLVSSIPETLKRISDCSEKFPSKKLDVPVSHEIYQYLSEYNYETPIDFFEIICNAILRYGFFDAHHAPIFSFLRPENVIKTINPHIFDLSEMNHVSHLLKRKGVKTASLNKNFNDRSNQVSSKNWTVVSPKLEKIRDKIKSRLEIMRYKQSHPMHKLMNIYNIESPSKSLVYLYNDLKHDALATERIYARVNHLYHRDEILYNNYQRYVEKHHTHDISSIEDHCNLESLI